MMSIVPSTAAATTPAVGVRHPIPEVTYPFHPRHSGLRAAARRLAGMVGDRPSASRAGAPSGVVAASVPRDGHVLRAPSSSGPVTDWAPGGTAGVGLGACDPGGARADALFAQAAAALPGLVACAGDVHSSARGRVELEHRQWVLRRDAVPAVDVSKRGRKSRWARRSRFAAGAASPCVAGVAS